MATAQVVLAALCVLLGVLPLWPLRFIREAVAATRPDGGAERLRAARRAVGPVGRGRRGRASRSGRRWRWWAAMVVLGARRLRPAARRRRRHPRGRRSGPAARSTRRPTVALPRVAASTCRSSTRSRGSTRSIRWRVPAFPAGAPARLRRRHVGLPAGRPAGRAVGGRGEPHATSACRRSTCCGSSWAPSPWSAIVLGARRVRSER